MVHLHSRLKSIKSISTHDKGISVEANALSAKGYKLIKEIGSGSYAKVYLSEYLPIDAPPDTPTTTLACKVIDTGRSPKDYARKFLPRELSIISRLSHPHIIHVTSIFQRKSKFFIFMRMAENGDLLEFILKYGALVEKKARVWFRQIASALLYIHNKDLAHRDLKCDNILITSNFNLKIADFGFSRVVADQDGKQLMSETYCGSLAYAAPEIIAGEPYLPKFADIWSLGVILYVMLDKTFPFDDNNTRRLYESQTTRKWKFKTTVHDMLSYQVKTLVKQMLEPDVKRRFSIEDVVDSDWLASSTIKRTLPIDSTAGKFKETKDYVFDTERLESVGAEHSENTNIKISHGDQTNNEKPNNEIIINENINNEITNTEIIINENINNENTNSEGANNKNTNVEDKKNNKFENNEKDENNENIENKNNGKTIHDDIELFK